MVCDGKKPLIKLCETETREINFLQLEVEIRLWQIINSDA